jgi:hypothetical protein
MVSKMTTPKRKFDLSPDLVQIDSSVESPNDETTEQVNSTVVDDNKLPNPVVQKIKPTLMTIGVAPEFKREYKVWCAKRGLKMQDAFIKAFELLKKHPDFS